MSPEQEYERMASREYQKFAEQEHAAQLSERKPVLRWKTRADLDAESVTVNEREYLVWHTLDGKWVSNAVRGDHPTADEAKLACEDHLATLLEPLAATYEKLRGNR